MKEQLLVLKKNLYSQGLTREAKKIDNIIKLAVTDETLEFQTQRSQREQSVRNELNKSNAVTETNPDYLSMMELAMDILGLIPGIGAVADVVSLILSMYQRKIIGSIINLIGLIPEAGTPAKLLIKNLNKIPASILKTYGRLALDLLDKVSAIITKSKFSRLSFKFGIDQTRQKLTDCIDEAIRGNDIDMNGNPVKSTGEQIAVRGEETVEEMPS